MTDNPFLFIGISIVDFSPSCYGPFLLIFYALLFSEYIKKQETTLSFTRDSVVI